MLGSVPHVVGGGHPGSSCFPFWVPTPATGREKPQEVALPTFPVSAVGVGSAMALLLVSCHIIRTSLIPTFLGSVVSSRFADENTETEKVG